MTRREPQVTCNRDRIPYQVPQYPIRIAAWLDSAVRAQYIGDMDIRPITAHYAVSPQITPEDAAAIKAAGFATVICNRPDAEVPPSHQAEALRIAVEAQGLRFEVLPITHHTMTPERVAEQAAMVAASSGPVLAYCASGTRCSVIWALGAVGTHSTDAILAAAAKAGYDLSPMRPALDAAASTQAPIAGQPT